MERTRFAASARPASRQIKTAAALALAALGATLGRARAQSASDWTAELERIVDLESAVERRNAARAFAKGVGARVAELENAARNFGRFEARVESSETLTTSLRVGSKNEDTELVLFTPSSYDPARPAPALLAFHGTGGRGAHMLAMWRATAEVCGVVVLAPTEAGPNDGYHFSQRERDAALAALRWLRRHVNVDENAIFATGVSRGGHLAWDLALRHPDLFAGIAPMIGSPRITIQDGQNNLRYIENVVRLPIRDLQGAQDDPALVYSVELAFEKLKKLGAADAQLFLQPEHGHSFDFGAVDWNSFFATARRDPKPASVVRTSARKAEGRAFWVEALDYAPSVEEEFTPKVSQLKWAQLDEVERRQLLVQLAEQRTSRLEIQRSGPGRFSAASTGVKRFRLLLDREDLARRDVALTWNGDSTQKRPAASATVLLEEFVERFDRTWLPVSELEIR